MKIFKDLLTGDELASDSYPMTLIDDLVYEVQAKTITITESGNYDIGGNPSQGGGEGEEPAPAEEGYEASSQTVINLVAAHKLQPTSFDKKSYTAYIKNYMKSLLGKLKENGSPRVDTFQKGAQAFVGKIVSGFDKFDGFYIGENDFEMKGMVLLMFYKEDGVTPYFYIFKDGVDEEKV